MSVFDVGDFWSRTFYVRNAAGTLVAPGAFTCTLTLADGSSPSVTVVNSSTGTYDCSYGPLLAAHVGRNLVFAAATGSNACSMPDQFDVRSSVSTALLSLDDARRTLNYTDATNTQDDEEIRDYVDAVTALIEAQIGNVIQRPFTEDVELWRDSFTVTQPIVSLTTLTPIRTGGIALAAADFQVMSTGRIVRKDGATIVVSPWNLYTVTYVSGRATIPNTVLQAARVLLQHLWRTQRGAGTRPGAALDVDLAAYSMPFRVLELLNAETSTGIA